VPDTLLRLGAIVSGTGVDVDVDALDDDVARARLASAVRSSSSVVAGRDVDELLALCRPERGPARLIDISLRLGRFGDGFGARAGGLSLAELRRHPHGIDFGPLVPRLDEALATPSGAVELAPPVMIDDLVRFTATHEIPADVDGASLHLIGRRDLRSNNSWMHNVNVLVKGAPRCTLQIHPDDAVAREITDGALVRITSSVGSIDVPAAVSSIVRRGVVSLPHGYGHHRNGARLDIARAHAGESFNDLVDTKVIDPHSGNAALNSTRVRVQPVATV
jgi:hypothetical protein